MLRDYNPYIPETTDELMDHLASMMLGSPKFEADPVYFPNMSIETEFFALNEGLKRLRRILGEDRYNSLTSFSNRMRAHFEADPENKTDDTIKGREIILEMRDLISRRET
jgi:hypothetical protein